MHCFLVSFVVVWCWMSSSIQVFHSSSLILSEAVYHLISPVFVPCYCLVCIQLQLYHFPTCMAVFCLYPTLKEPYTCRWALIELINQLINTNIFMLYCFRAFNLHLCFLIFQNLFPSVWLFLFFFQNRLFTAKTCYLKCYSTLNR